ncbi:MAG: phosphoethanolamine transferase [Agitococcus sp.]|nr:phosphoethanolamine transferase [Agitococcus sp.]
MKDWPQPLAGPAAQRYLSVILLAIALPFFIVELRSMYPYALIPMAKKIYDYQQISTKVDTSLIPEVSPLNSANPPSNELMVMVIGESSQAEFWQINGFAQETSPFIVARQKKGELINFPKHMSAASATFLAVPSMLTPFGKIIEFRDGGWSPSLMSLMKKASRHTAWFSTQSPQPASTEADDVDFVGDFFNYYDKALFDEALVPHAAQWMKKYADTPSFLVLHTLGSHIPFERRYPNAFKKWAVPEAEYPKSQTVANYSNTILYTDYVLEQVMKKMELEKRPALLVYVSDHGETLMRGISRSASPAGAAILHVPLMIWANALWRTAHPDQWALLATQANTQPVTHHLNLAPTLTHLAGLQYEGMPHDLDLLSAQFKPWKSTPAIEPDLKTVSFIAPP